MLFGCLLCWGDRIDVFERKKSAAQRKGADMNTKDWLKAKPEIQRKTVVYGQMVDLIL